MSDYEQKKLENYLESRKPEDIALSEYWEFYGDLIEKAELPRDWDLLDKQVETFLGKYNPNIQSYILKHQNDWIKDLPPEAKRIEEIRIKGIEDRSWWKDYRELRIISMPKERKSTEWINPFKK